MERLADEKFLRWAALYEVVPPARGSLTVAARLAPKRDERGRPILSHVEGVVLPTHEAVKRARGRKPKPRLEWFWLRAALAVAGREDSRYDCTCGCGCVVCHNAMLARTTAEQVEGAIKRASWDALRTLKRLAPEAVLIAV